MRTARIKKENETVCATSLQNLAVQRNLIPLSMSLWNDLADPVFDGGRLAGFKSRANASLLAKAALSLL